MTNTDLKLKYFVPIKGVCDYAHNLERFERHARSTDIVKVQLNTYLLRIYNAVALAGAIVSAKGLESLLK